jgi:hypothetical protein
MPRRAICLLLLLLATWWSLLGSAASQDLSAAARGPSPDEVDQAVDTVFADPAFKEGLDTTHLTADELVRLAEYAFDYAYQSVMNFLANLEKDSPLFYNFLMVAMVVILVVCLYHLFWTFNKAFRGVGEGQGEGEGEDDGERVRRYRDLRAEARSLASGGDPREGIRMLLLALLALLAEEEVLRVARSWTPREILARLAAKGSFGDELALFGGEIETALYAEHTVTLEAFEASEATLETLKGGLQSAVEQTVG